MILQKYQFEFLTGRHGRCIFARDLLIKAVGALTEGGEQMDMNKSALVFVFNVQLVRRTGLE